jgi:hypothetical protein
MEAPVVTASVQSLRCKLSWSAGGSGRAVFTRGGSGVTTQAWSVDVAALSEVVGLNVAAVGGGASVTVHGREFAVPVYVNKHV